MAPPDKDVMGVRVHVKTDPPGDGDPTPPRPRAKTASKPVVELEPEAETQEAAPASRPPYARKHSPAGGIKLEGPGGWKLSMPHAALLAILACFGGAGVAAKMAATDTASDRAEMLAELRSIREEVKGVRADVREVRDEQEKRRKDSTKILNYAEGTFTPIVASLRKLGVKFTYSGDDDPAREVEFHAAPLGGTAPPIQPKATLPERPSL